MTYCPFPAAPLLAFDIETTGLSESDTVTCVCAYDAERGIDFRACTPQGGVCDEFLQLLDEAPLLCAFNGVMFDLPFLAKRWSVPSERVARWVVKLLDPYQACKLALGVTFSLDRLLGANGLECKTGSGKEAVVMAREGRWAELEEYCMNDTAKTHGVVSLGPALLPTSGSLKKKTASCLVASDHQEGGTQNDHGRNGGKTPAGAADH